MILGFTQKIHLPGTKLHGQPTHFKEKILAGITRHQPQNPHPPQPAQYTPKLHTIREDKKERWKAGMGIEMCYGVRTKQFECFNSVRTPDNLALAPSKRIKYTGLGEVVSLQKIEIHRLPPHPHHPRFTMPMEFRNGKHKVTFNASFTVHIDGRALSIPEIEQLALNDGFTDATEFFTWFNDRFVGRIIHWTPLKY